MEPRRVPLPERPLARRDLVVRAVSRPEGESWAVLDGVRRVTFWFGPFEYRIFAALDGRQTVDALAKSLGFGHPTERERVVTLVAELAAAGLLEGEGTMLDLHAERLLQIAEDEIYWGQLLTRPLAAVLGRLLEGQGAAGADCPACHLPCCSYAVDVAEGEAEPFTEAAAAQGFPPARLFDAETFTSTGRELRRLLRGDDGQCVLLDETRRCRVHAVAGFDRKPLVCQLYPASPALTPDGPRVTLRSGCARPFPVDDADAVAAYHATLRGLAATRPDLPVPSAPSEVCLAAGVSLPWAAWAALEGELLVAMKSAPDADGALDAAVRVVRRAARLPDAPPDLALLRVVAGGLSSLVGEGGRAREAGVLGDLASGAPAAAPRPCPGGAPAIALHALYPLRFPSVLAGLGALRLVLAVIDVDPEARERPHEAAAGWFRLLRAQAIHVALVHGGTRVLEAMA